MGFGINLFHMVEIQLGVNLGCVDATVAKQFLDNAQIGPTPDQMNGIGVPQRVGTHRRFNTGIHPMPLQNRISGLSAEGPSP